MKAQQVITWVNREEESVDEGTWQRQAEINCLAHQILSI